MEKTLEGKIALITGASRGLGKAMALSLSSAGAKLALAARDKAKLEETAAEAAGESAIFIADVTDERQVAALERDVIARFGHVDILINNAGVNIRKPVIEYQLDEWRKI